MTTFLLFIRMLLALGFVLGLLYVCSRIARRFQSRGVLPGARSAAGSAGRAPRIAGRGAPTSRKMAFARAGRLPRVQRTAADGYGIEVLQRRALSKTSAIFLVNAGGRLLVLGSSAQSVQLLADLGEGHPDEDAEDPFDAAALLGIPDTVPADYASYLDTKRSPRTAAPALPAGSATAWEAIMTTLRERTVRR